MSRGEGCTRRLVEGQEGEGLGVGVVKFRDRTQESFAIPATRRLGVNTRKRKTLSKPLRLGAPFGAMPNDEADDP